MHANSLNYCFSTIGCPNATWEEAARIAASHHFAGVELRALRGRIDLPTLLAEEFGTPERMAAALSKSDLRVVALDSSMQLLGAQEEHRREVERLAEWADALGVPFVRVFDGDASPGRSNEEMRTAMISELELWAEVRDRKQFKCDLMIETHGVFSDPESWLHLAAEATTDLHLLWDTCHTWNRCGVAPTSHWEMLKPWVRHIHVKDAVRDSAAHKGLRYVLPGKGDFPIHPLLAALKRDRFTGPVSLEWELLWKPELPALEEALASGREAAWW